MDKGIGGMGRVDDPGGGHGDGHDEQAGDGHGSGAENGGASNGPNKLRNPAPIAETDNTTVETRDVVERGGRIRHNRRYSNSTGYIDATAVRAS